MKGTRDQVNMELTIKNLKGVLLETVGQDLINQGYNFSKSNFAFKKRQNKVDIVVQVFTYDYKPVWLSYNYVFSFTLIEEIEAEYKKYLAYYKQDYFKLKLALCEGDFYSETKNMTIVHRIGYDHKIHEISASNPEIGNSRQLLKGFFFSMVEIYTDKEKFTDFVTHNHYEVARLPSVLYPALIAAKLKGFSELQMLVKYLWDKLSVDDLPPDHRDRKFLTNIVEYAKANP